MPHDITEMAETRKSQTCLGEGGAKSFRETTGVEKKNTHQPGSSGLSLRKKDGRVNRGDDNFRKRLTFSTLRGKPVHERYQGKVVGGKKGGTSAKLGSGRTRVAHTQKKGRPNRTQEGEA